MNLESMMDNENGAGGMSALTEVLERRIADLGKWFSDNPNTADIEDGIRCLVRDAIFSERMACAMVCEAEAKKWEGDGVPEPMGRLCAEAIRKRSNAVLRGAEGVPLENIVRGENPGKVEQ